MNTSTSQSIIIVGGGIAGLLAGSRLNSRGCAVQILDKGRGIGGRLATRSISDPKGEAVFDYGAQYFTARDSRFQQLVQSWLETNVIKEWSDGFYDQNGVFKSTLEPRYRGTISNRAVAKHLAEDLNVRTSTKVTRLAYKKNRWLVATETGDTFESDCLLLTSPAPQSLELLGQSSIPLRSLERDQLQTIEYAPCFSVLAVLSEESAIPHPGGLWLDGNPLSWIADNHKKGISPASHAVTIHAGPEFSAQHFEADKERVAHEMIAAAKPYIVAEIKTFQIHRWKFATPLKTFGTPYFFCDVAGPLFFAGDSFGGTRVEGAALSGIEAANAIVEWSTSQTS